MASVACVTPDYVCSIFALLFTRSSLSCIYVTAHVLFFGVLAAMIGNMADEKELDEKAANSDSEEEDDEEEEMANGRNDVGGDESEFDDPEGFVDDITDEGKILNTIGEHASCI